MEKLKFWMQEAEIIVMRKSLDDVGGIRMMDHSIVVMITTKKKIYL